MPDNTVASLRALLAAQSALLTRAQRRVTDLERQLAAAPRGPTVGTHEVGVTGQQERVSLVQGTETMDSGDLILHMNARHLGTHSALIRMHLADHALSDLGQIAPHEHVTTEWSDDDGTQETQAPDSACSPEKQRGASAGETRRP